MNDQQIHDAATSAIAIFCHNLDLWGRMSQVLWLLGRDDELMVTTHRPSDRQWQSPAVIWDGGPHPQDPVGVNPNSRWPESMVPAILSVPNLDPIYRAFYDRVGSDTWPKKTPDRHMRYRCYQEAVADATRNQAWFDTAWDLPGDLGPFVRRSIAPRCRSFVQFEMESLDGQSYWTDVILRALNL